MLPIVVSVLININRILTAGIAVLGFSLVLYSLTFNLKDRVARAFAIIMICVAAVFVGDAVSSITTERDLLEFWLKLQWIGIIFLPFAYFYFSDALLATTGRPSRGRRRIVVRLSLFASCVFFILLVLNYLVGEVVTVVDSAPYLKRTWLTWVFAGYYGLMMLWSWVNFYRAYRRTVTASGKRRMVYLMAGATAPALGSFPFILFGANVVVNHHLLFWLAVVVSNGVSGALIVLMSYAVAFFGVDQPDRVIKSRLFRWLFRGPITAIIILAIITFIRQLGKQLGYQTSAIEILAIIGSLLFMQYFITLIAPWVEKKLFLRGDEEMIKIIQTIEEHAITPHDLLQFLEAVLTSACDRLGSAEGFIAQFRNSHLDIIVKVGEIEDLDEISAEILKSRDTLLEQNTIIPCKGYWLIPLRSAGKESDAYEVALDQFNGDEDKNHLANHSIFGIMGISQVKQKKPLMIFSAISELTGINDDRGSIQNVCGLDRDNSDDEQPIRSDGIDEMDQKALLLLAQRAVSAIQNHAMQQQWFNALQELSPQVEVFQRLRAAASFNGSQLLEDQGVIVGKIQPNVLKEALDHYWGGPKLTQSPLLDLQVVRDGIKNGESAANVLREVLRSAIESMKPSGERRYTSDWLLYNILTLKFFEGVKVREIAHRLAISEADFYRKQRIAIHLLARRLHEMEMEFIRTKQELAKRKEM